MADKPSDRPHGIVREPYRPSGRPITVVPVYGAPSKPERFMPDRAPSLDAQIARLVALRLSPAITDEGVRAELDSIIGALRMAR